MSKLQVYRASAGSGKTYQLALKYITLLLGQWHGRRFQLYTGSDLRRHREILAITFTNKATQEMRLRIVKELALLADPNEKTDYKRVLHQYIAPDDTELKDQEVDHQISMAAMRALDSMLFDLGEIQVSTIDAFFQRVLRSFAYEADLAGNYELMLENNRMTDMAIADMLALACGMKGLVMPKGVSSGYLRERVGELINTRISNGQEYKIFNADSALRADMVRFISHLSDEDYQKKKSEIEKFLSIPNAIKNLVDALKQKRVELMVTLRHNTDSLLMTEAATYLNGRTGKPMFDKISAGEIGLLTGTNLDYMLPEADLTKLLKSNKLSNVQLADFVGQAEAILELLRNIMSIDLLLCNANFLGLFREILIIQQSLKAHLNTILLSDTNELLRLIIDDSETPFIYERIGRKLRHFLIDEFQDTSRMQWANLLPLLSESLGNGNENLIIGDVKQCIYRFRNSNPELLAHDIERTPQICDYIQHCELDTNWRSAPVVVDFNNRLFENIGQRVDVLPPKADAYSSVRQKAHNTDVPGYVDISLVPKEDKNAGFKRMFEHIDRELQSGYTPSDIVILVRTRADAHETVEAMLDAIRNGLLPADLMVVSDEALYVSSARSVQWIIARLQEMNSLPEPIRRMNSRGLPRASKEDIDWLQEHLVMLSKDDSIQNPLEQAIADFNARRISAGSGYEPEPHRLLRASGQSLFEIVEELIRNLPDDGMRQDDAQYLSAFQDLVLDYCRHRAPSLQGFLKQWEEEWSETAAVGLADGVNAIRVMTIHKSKGLEFNCVHIPILKKQINEERNNRWYDVAGFLEMLGLDVDTPHYYPLSPKSGVRLEYTVFSDEIKALKDAQTIDEVNALYVAFTRAKQELIVSINDPRSAKKQSEPLPINYPAGLICPALSQMAGTDGNNWTFGSVTTKYADRNKTPRRKGEMVHSLEIRSYKTQKRKDMWSQTKAARITDAGEPI